MNRTRFTVLGLLILTLVITVVALAPAEMLAAEEVECDGEVELMCAEIVCCIVCEDTGEIVDCEVFL